MVHRLHNRNAGYSNNVTSTLTTNQATLNATEGATALNLNNIVEENTNAQENTIVDQKSEQIQENVQINEPLLENVSMENAAYLQSVEETSNYDESKSEDIPSFEVDSIELATPELFSENESENTFNQDNSETEPKIFENSKSENEVVTKEPEMFEEPNLEEDFEIPAFLRRQKN